MKNFTKTKLILAIFFALSLVMLSSCEAYNKNSETLASKLVNKTFSEAGGSTSYALHFGEYYDNKSKIYLKDGPSGPNYKDTYYDVYLREVIEKESSGWKRAVHEIVDWDSNGKWFDAYDLDGLGDHIYGTRRRFRN